MCLTSTKRFQDRCSSIIMVSESPWVYFNSRVVIKKWCDTTAIKLFSIKGGLHYNFNFSKNIPSLDYIETRDFSCTAVLNGEFYMLRNHIVFDDSHNYNLTEMYKIINCGFELVDELSVPFLMGSCGTFLFPEQRIFLCFGDESRKKCFRLMFYFFPIIYSLYNTG